MSGWPWIGIPAPCQPDRITNTVSQENENAEPISGGRDRDIDAPRPVIAALPMACDVACP